MKRTKFINKNQNNIHFNIKIIIFNYYFYITPVVNVARNVRPVPHSVTRPVSVNHHVPRLVTRPVSVNHIVSRPVTRPVSVKHSVQRSVTRPVSVKHHVPCSVTPPVSVSNVCKPVRTCFVSNHTQPLRKLNKVKPPKYEKCDYVHIPSSPVSVSVPRPVPSPVIHRRHRRRNRRYRNRSVDHPVKCNVNRPITHTVEQNEPPPIRSLLFIYFFTLVNILYSLFYTPFFVNSFNFCLFISLNILCLFMKAVFKFIYLFIKFLTFLKYSYKYFLILIFVCVFFIRLIEVSSDVNFVNNNSNYNLSTSKDFNSYDNLLFKPNIYYALYSYEPHRDFNSVSNLSPPQSNIIKEFEGTSILIISILCFLFWFKIKSKSFLSFLFTVIVVYYLFINSPIKISRIDEKLHFCSKLNFFTNESVKICNGISQAYLRSSLNFFTLSKLKYKNNPSFFNHILLLSGDISLNPGPNQSQLNSDTWSPFKKRGLHFLHLNINSLLPKIDELRYIAEKSKVAVIGISETKLDNSVLNEEINIKGYNILRLDRNRHGGGVACYIRNDLTFNQINIFSIETENIFFDILLPNSHSITIGIFYRPPNQNKFLENISNDFLKLYTEKKEVIILGDININLFQNGKYILDENKNSLLGNTATHTLLKQYKYFLSNFGLKQLIKTPTRVSCETSTIIHLFTNKAAIMYFRNIYFHEI